ncbi:MAG: helix-turn-helix transcriptional regulator [Patescibacteria group bacterium]
MKKINRKKWISAEELEKKLMKDPEFVKAYNDLETEFQIASQMIEARIKQNITQEELAKKVNTGQAVISRLEGATAKPSISLLERVARALNIKFNITIQ